MDLSKLPKLSKTDRPGGDYQQQPQSEAHADGAREYDPPSSVVGAEAWISIALGIILILFAPRIWQYWITPGSFTWTFADKQGAPLAYTKSAFFLADLGVALFAIVLILDGVVLVLRRFQLLLVAALGLTSLTTIFNVVVIVMTVGEIGVQIMPVIAIALGGYIAMYQWHRLRQAGK